LFPLGCIIALAEWVRPDNQNENIILAHALTEETKEQKESFEEMSKQENSELNLALHASLHVV
jgi:hypothetical protein